MKAAGGGGGGGEQCKTMVDLGQKMAARSAAVSKPMAGRKQHAAACGGHSGGGGGGLVFVHGGWTFDGKTRDPVGQMYAALVKRGDVRWVSLGESGVRRAGHVCCRDDTRVVLHGGEGARGAVHGTLHQLVVSSS